MERVLVCLKISDGFITFPEQDNTSSRESMMPDHLHLVPRLPPPNPPHDASGAPPSSPEYAQRKCKYMSHVTLQQVLGTTSKDQRLQKKETHYKGGGGGVESPCHTFFNVCMFVTKILVLGI